MHPALDNVTTVWRDLRGVVGSLEWGRRRPGVWNRGGGPMRVRDQREESAAGNVEIVKNCCLTQLPLCMHILPSLNLPLLVLFTIPPLSLTSCQTVKTLNASSNDLHEVGSQPRSGNFYFLPKVLIRISGTYIDDKNTFEISLERILIPDRTARRFVEYQPNSWSEDEISFVVNSKGLIDGGFLSVAENKTGEVVETLADTAINVWKIGSYGSTEGLVGATPFLATAASPSEAGQSKKLISFDWTFDPYSTEAKTGRELGNFLVRADSEIDNKLSYEPPIDVFETPVDRGPKTKGLQFRAPDVVTISIGSISKSDVRDKKLSQAGAEGAGLASAEPANSNSLITPPTISPEQKSGSVYKWRIFNATTDVIDFNANMAVKTVDLSTNSEVSFSFSRAAFVKKGIALAFADGELLGTHIQKPSEVKAFVDIPKNITEDVANAFPTLIKISDTRASRDISRQMQDQILETERLKAQAALLTQQHALLDAQLKVLNARRDLNSND